MSVGGPAAPYQDLRTALVIVNFGSHDLLRANLAWVATAAEPLTGHVVQDPLDVVVVDNFKSFADAEQMRVLAAQSGWDLVALDVNCGFGAGVNRGVARALERGAEAVVMLNPDLELSRADVRALTAEVSRAPASLVSPFVVDASGRPWGRLGRVDVRAGRLYTNDLGTGPRWLSGACLAVHRDLWRKLDGMDPDYFMYWEDVDLSVRAAEAGAGLRVLDDVVVVHDPGGTQLSVSGKSSAYYYYNCRNRLIFAAKRLTAREFLRWLWLTPADVRRVISRGQPANRWAKLRCALPPALRGCASGVWWAISSSWRLGEGQGRRDARCGGDGG